MEVICSLHVGSRMKVKNARANLRGHWNKSREREQKCNK